MSVRTFLVPLRALLQAEEPSNEAIKRALKSFSCIIDDDVALFLSQYSIANEKSGSCRTYLVLNADRLQECNELDIVAFFTLAITATDYSAVSIENRKSILGNIRGINKNTYFPGYLLAQLARNDAYTHDDFDCVLLVAEAEKRFVPLLKS